MITLKYLAVDGFRTEKTFSSLKEAQEFAVLWAGARCEVGRTYAITYDGVGRLTWTGVTAEELFPKEDSPVVPKSQYDEEIEAQLDPCPRCESDQEWTGNGFFCPSCQL